MNFKEACTAVADLYTAMQEQTPQYKILCHSPNDRCLGCLHYHGKAAVCAYATAAQEQRDHLKAIFAALDAIVLLPEKKERISSYDVMTELVHIREAALALGRSDLVAAESRTAEPPEQEQAGLTFDEVEAYREEHTISKAPLPEWAREENRVLNALCFNYLTAIAAPSVKQETLQDEMARIKSGGSYGDLGAHREFVQAQIDASPSEERLNRRFFDPQGRKEMSRWERLLLWGMAWTWMLTGVGFWAVIIRDWIAQ